MGKWKNCNFNNVTVFIFIANNLNVLHYLQTYDIFLVIYDAIPNGGILTSTKV